MKKIFSALALVLPIACWAQVSSLNGNFTATTPSNLSLQTQVGTTTTTRLTIRSSGATAGFVGVNTTSPADWFHVNGNIRANQINSFTGILNTTSSTVGLSFRTNNTAQMTIKPDGNVGIGTTNPLNKLQIGPNPNGWLTNDFVVANGNGALAINTNATNTYLWGSKDISIRPGNGGNPSIYAKSDGTVGIGTDNPNSAYKLDVAGTLNATSILVGGQPLTSVASGAFGGEFHFSNNQNVGFTWWNENPTSYGIYRTAGGWDHPNYQQLKLNWDTGIILNPGTAYGKSYVDVQGNGLRISSGALGIGTTNPLNGLNIFSFGNFSNGSIRFGHSGTNDGVLSLGYNSTTGRDALKLSYFPHNSTTGQTDLMTLDINGSVGIGTTTPGSFKLAVEGKIGAREVNVTMTNPWPDYVFEPTYNLSPLDSIKTYIDKNKHLPEVPSAKEMEKNGVNLGEMNMLLLKKIEELTLYQIEMNRKIEEGYIKSTNDRKRIEELENLIKIKK
jgi:hypothetical protein